MNKRHVIDEIRRPGPGTTGTGQQDPASDTVVASQVPCEINRLRGRELEVQRTTYAPAAATARFYVDPSWQITPNDYVIIRGQRWGIGSVHDPTDNQDGTEVLLILGQGDSS